VGLPATKSAARAVQRVEDAWPMTAAGHADARRETRPPTKSERPYITAESKARTMAIR
jgi:hypothetical protein